MGMYTEIVVATQIKNVPEVVEILKFMCKCGNAPKKLPSHELFSTARWACLFTCCSHYFVPASMSLFEYNSIANAWSLIVRADLKNYNNEIEKFFDWIQPYLDRQNGDMIGYSRYEETREPTIWYQKSA